MFTIAIIVYIHFDGFGEFGEYIRIAIRIIVSYVVIDCQLECGPMPNLMVALPNIGGALCSTPQSLADDHY